MASPIVFVVSVDTEEDNWRPARGAITLDNIRGLPRLHAFLARLGVRTTFFATYQVASPTWAADILRDIHGSGTAEVAAHLHPWNTPPLEEPFVPSNSMVKNLPFELQRAKLQALTALLECVLGQPPATFRAGRFGIGPETTRALVSCGYRVDSSVLPFVSFERVDDGATFVGAPLNAYRLCAGTDVRQPSVDGPLFEVPLSCGYNRRPFEPWQRVHELLSTRAMTAIGLAGLAFRAGLIRRITLTPEINSVEDMLLLSRLLIDHGVHHLQLFFHSPTISPGLTPFARAPADVERLYASIGAYVEGLAKIAALSCATVGEAASTLMPSRLA